MLRSAVKDNLDALQRVAEQGLTGAQYTFGLLYDLAERLYAFARQGYTELFIVVVIAFIAFRVLVGFSRGFRGLRPGDTIIGRAYVTDGDGLMVSGYKIRMASLDAPEWDQMARHQDGYWFNHGKTCQERIDSSNWWQESSSHGQGIRQVRPRIGQRDLQGQGRWGMARSKRARHRGIRKQVQIHRT